MGETPRQGLLQAHLSFLLHHCGPHGMGGTGQVPLPSLAAPLCRHRSDAPATAGCPGVSRTICHHHLSRGCSCDFPREAPLISGQPSLSGSCPPRAAQGGGGGGIQRGRENGSFFKVMNGRKRKWKGGQGEEKGTDFQIKFSGHLNKHLSQRSNGRGTAGGTCVSWTTLEAFQQDTSNKQHLKRHVCSLSQGFSSEIPLLQFPPCLQLGPKLASISSPILSP